MTKKYFYSLCFLFTLSIFLLAPFLVGLVCQRHYPVALQEMANHFHLDLRVIEYQRGWFHSNVKLAANFPLLDQPLPEKLHGENALLIQQRITHGPFIFSHRFVPSLLHIKSFLQGGQLLADSWVYLNKSISTHFAVRQYVVTSGRHTQPYYAVNHLVGDSFLSGSGRQFFATVRCGSIDAYIDHPRHVKDFLFHQELTRSPSNLWLGNTNYHFGELTWNQSGDVYTFNNLDYGLQSNEVSQRVSATLVGNMTMAMLNGRPYGPQAVSVSLSNLESPQLKRLLELFPLSKSHLVTPHQFMAAKQQLLALLDAGAAIKVNALQLNTKWGPILLTGASGCASKKQSVSFEKWCSNTDLLVHANIPTPVAYKILMGFCQTRPNYADAEVARKWVDHLLVEWQKAGWVNNTGNQLLIKFVRGKLAVALPKG